MEIHEHESIEGEQKGDRWSNLPTLLIWMIKARLDVPNNFRLAAVCKSWQHASSSYPIQHHCTKDALPWVMLFEGENGSKREFISSSTGEKYTIDNPDFYETTTLSSKKGWLLLARNDRYCEKKKKKFSNVFLLNPFFKKRIMLPRMDLSDMNHIVFKTKPFHLACGAFTIVDDNPHHIVLVNCSFGVEGGICPYILLWIVQPGDDKWTMHCYRCWRPEGFDSILDILIVEQLVYCFNEHSRVFVFNMVDLQWTDTMEKADTNGKPNYFITESEGELFKLHLDKSLCSPAIYRLNSTNADWEPLKDEDTNGWTWFIRRPRKGFFLFKGNKSKTFEQVYKNMEKYYPIFCRFNNGIHAHLVDMD